MLFQPAIIALLLGSVMVCLMLLFSCYDGLRILKRWDLRSGSELQLNLERRTYLISTIMSYAFGFQIVSLFLFIYTADKLNTLFVGAMCAAGSLNANPWGYPAIILKIVNCLLAGLWLILNFTDNRGYDYPLIKKKYSFLVVITPFILAETFLQGSYFLGLEPEVITSCCGTLFTSDTQGVTSTLIALPRVTVEASFYTIMGLTFAAGGYFYLKGRGGYLFSGLGLAALIVSVIAFISFICVYFYELPTHHCPFCILQREYGFIGYPLYATFLGGAILGVGVGLIMPFRRIGSLKGTLPAIQKRLTFFSLLSYLGFMVIVIYQLIFSNLKM